MTELPRLPGGTASQPLAINNNGQIVGYSTTDGSAIDGPTHAVLSGHPAAADRSVVPGSRVSGARETDPWPL